MNGTYAGQQTGPRLIDELLRRELRVGNPRSAAEVVTALRKRYVSDAGRIDQEAAGLPIRYQPPAGPAPSVIVTGDTPGTKEERRVQVNLESDLTALIESRDNREWAPEIRGWRDVLLREQSDGAAAARFAQDPAMRDRAFLAVRKLGEFSRVARLVGVMNVSLNCDYRRLACTLDDGATVIRVLMGEALYGAGLGDGGIVIQVPVFELRDRRDALVLAVRRLSGTEVDTGNDDWGDALAAYRALLSELQLRGAPELRVYLRPDTLATILDGLVGDVARQDPDALRQVAATSPVEIARLQRLRAIANGLLTRTPQGPLTAALTLYVRTLELFVDGFGQIRSGARLIDLALPLPLAAQQTDEPDREGRRALRDLVSLRGEYSQEVECFLSCCGCDHDDLKCQVKLDKVLYDLDRAIDLYAQGTGVPPTWGADEQRAGVYGVVAQNLANDRCCIAPTTAFELLLESARCTLDLLDAVGLLARAPIGAPGDPLADQAGPYFRHALTAAEAANPSRELAEGIRRELFNVPAAIQAQLTLGQAQFVEVVTDARDVPLDLADALELLIDVIELAVGLTRDRLGANVIALNIAGVVRTVVIGGPNFDIFTATLPAPQFGRLGIARDALVASANALRTALRAIGDTVAGNAAQNRQDARARAGDVATAVQAAIAALNPQPPVNIPAGERVALSAAVDAGTAAVALAIRVGGLPIVQAFEPVALGQILNQVGTTLQAALPVDPGARQAVIAAVFDEQLRAEKDWQELVRSLAPRCLGPGRADLALAGLDLLRASPRHLAVIDAAVPFFPDERVSLDRIATDIGRVSGYVDAVVASAGRIRNSANAFGRGTGADRVIRESVDALREVTTEAVRVAERDGLVDQAKRDVMADINNRATRGGSGSSGFVSASTAQGQASSRTSTPPDLQSFLLRLYPNCGSRKEVQQALASDPTLEFDWYDITKQYRDRGITLEQSFESIIDDLFNTSATQEIDRDRLYEECRKAVYPHPLIKN